MSPLSIGLIIISALIHSSWNFFTKRGNWPEAFFFWVFLCGVLLYLPFFLALGTFPSLLFQAPLKLWVLTVSSGFFETVYFLSLVGGYRGGDLSLVYPISRSAPLFTQVWAILLIGEVLPGIGVLGIFLVIIGLFVVSMKDFRIKQITLRPNGSVSRPYLLALNAAIASSVYSVIDKVGVQMVHPVFYIWFINLWMTVFMGFYLILRKETSFRKIWQESKKEILLISILQNIAYLFVLLAMQMSKVSYVVAFRQVGALFGAAMGIYFLKESYWKTRITGALILVAGLVIIALAE